MNNQAILCVAVFILCLMQMTLLMSVRRAYKRRVESERAEQTEQLEDILDAEVIQ